jgi:hypothetical protein
VSSAALASAKRSRYAAAMTGAVLDTHRMVKQLVGTGMPEAQAEAVVDLVKETHDHQVTRDVLRYELALVEERLGKRIDLLDKELTLRLGSMLAAAVVLVGALVAIS